MSSRYRSWDQAFDDVDYSSGADDGPVAYQLSEAVHYSRTENLWPIHRHVSYFLATLITGFWILTISTLIGMIVIMTLPEREFLVEGAALTERSIQLSGDNNLSWPSACWALVAIALNTMCQPFGQILGMPSRHSFALRSSPAICIFDALAILLEISYHTFQTKHLLDAINTTVRGRFADVSIHDDGSFAALQKNTMFRALLFFLGAVPQAVKLYAVKGILWTKVLATIYIASFIICELIATIARRDRVNGVDNDTDTGKIREVQVISFLIVLAISVVLAYAFFTSAVFVIFKNYWHHAAWPLILSACALNVLYICSVISSKRDLMILCSGPLVSVSGVALSGAVSTPLGLLAFAQIPLMWLPENRGATIGFAIVVVMATLITSISFYRLTRNLSTRYGRYMHFELSAFYFLLHLITVFLTYCFLYNPQSTSKPAWTEYLG